MTTIYHVLTNCFANYMQFVLQKENWRADCGIKKQDTIRAKVMGNQKRYQIEDCLKNKRYCKNSKKFAFRYWCFMKDRIRVTARYRSILRITDFRLWEMKTQENDKICPSKYPAAVAHHTLHLFVSLSKLSVSGNLLWHH